MPSGNGGTPRALILRYLFGLSGSGSRSIRYLFGLRGAGARLIRYLFGLR